MATSHMHYSQAGPSSMPYHANSQPPGPPPANNMYSQSHYQSDPRRQVGPGPPIHTHGSRMGGNRRGYPVGSSRLGFGYHHPLPPSQHYQPNTFSAVENNHHARPPHRQQPPHMMPSTPMALDHQTIHSSQQFAHDNPPPPPPPPLLPYYQPHAYANFTPSFTTSTSPSFVPQGSPAGIDDRHHATMITSPKGDYQSNRYTLGVSSPATHNRELSPNVDEYSSSPPSHSASVINTQPVVHASDSLKSVTSESRTVFPDMRNIKAGYALQSHRPRVSEAVAVTVSQAARPPSLFYKLLIPSEDQDVPMKSQLEGKQHSLSIATDAEQLSPPQESSMASTSTATPETSTAPLTPQLGSPHSSITSISITNKSPVLTSPVPENTPLTPSPPNQVNAQPTSVVTKSWASLLKPNNSISGSSRQDINGLPTSSVQGFSIPATIQPEVSSAKSKPSPELIKLFTATTLQTGRLPSIQARGIINLAFHNLFKELDRLMPGLISKTGQTNESLSTPLVAATITFMKEFDPINTPLNDDKNEQDCDVENGPFVPTYIYEALKEKKRFDSMWGGQQEDAEEFLGFYLDTLEEELLSMLGTSSLVPAEPEEAVEDLSAGWSEVGKRNKAVVTRTHKAVESPISRIFGGKSRTSRRVPGARETAMVDPWSRLQLDIQPDSVRSIEDALRHIATPETIHISSSSRPGRQVETSQQTLIDVFPSVLVLHLKRFLYDTTVNDVIKLRKGVAYGPELEIPREVLSVKTPRPPKYKLFGVLNHHGDSATGGHYTLDVLHPNPRKNGEEGWIRIDDDIVQNIFETDLVTKDEGDDRSAYLLFYRRIPGSRRS